MIFLAIFVITFLIVFILQGILNVILSVDHKSVKHWFLSSAIVAGVIAIVATAI